MTTDRPNQAEMEAALEVTLAVSEAIREAGELPAGPLYAIVCHRVGLGGFDAMIATLVRAKLVERKGDLLRWTGPDLDNPRKHAGQGLTGWR